MRARLPRLAVTIDGATVGGAGAAALRAVTVTQRANLPDQVEIVAASGAIAGLRPGTPLRLDVEGHSVPLFTGELVAVEQVYGPDGGRTTRGRGYDALHHLRVRHDVAVHEGVTMGALAKAWCTELGLSTQVTADGPQLDRLVQPGESALGVLQSLSARSGVMFHLRQKTLHLFGPDGVGDVLPLRWGSTLREVRLDENTTAAPRPVRVEAWDPLAASTFSVEEPGQGAAVPIAGAVASTEEEAAALARALSGRRARAAAALWGVADGDPRLRPGAVVALSGDEALRGTHTLMAVTHRFDDATGFSSELSTALAPPGEAAGAPGIQLGTVADVADPDGLGRVAVTVDALDRVATSWLQVLTVGAGDDKGLVMLPDVGDRVLVLAPAGDVGRGIVLGGLYGAAGAYDPGVVEAAVQRCTWRTRGGQLVRLDDERRAVRLEDATGSFIDLSPERVLVHAAVDLTLEAPGRAVLVTAASVDFEEG